MKTELQMLYEEIEAVKVKIHQASLSNQLDLAAELYKTALSMVDRYTLLALNLNGIER